MIFSAELDDFVIHFNMEKDPNYVLHEKFDSLDTRTNKMFKKGEICAYTIHLKVNFKEHFESIEFLESGFLFSSEESKSKEDLKEFLEEGPIVDDVLEKINLYKQKGTLLRVP